MDVDVEVEVEVELMLMLKEMEGRTRISLLDTEIEKLSRRNAYRQVISALTKTIFIHSLYSTMMISKAAKRSHNISWQRVIEELTEKCRSQEGQMEQVEDEIDENDGNYDDNDDDGLPVYSHQSKTDNGGVLLAVIKVMDLLPGAESHHRMYK